MTAAQEVPGGIDNEGADRGERQALELADRIRMVAAQDPALAQDIVDRLIRRLDEATEGAFREYLDDATRTVAERVLAAPRAGEAMVPAPVGNS